MVSAIPLISALMRSISSLSILRAGAKPKRVAWEAANAASRAGHPLG